MDLAVHFAQKQLINAKVNHALMEEHVNLEMVGFDVLVLKVSLDQIVESM